MNYQRGFSLIEIIVVLGILALIASIGLFVSMDFWRGSSSHSEQDSVVSLLENARSQSLNNIDQVRHGVHFDASPLRYTEFECTSSTCTDYSGADTSKDLVINSSSNNVSVTAPVLPFDIIFDQLNGACITTTSPTPFICDPATQQIKINDGVKDYIITVNSEGQIDWK